MWKLTSPKDLQHVSDMSPTCFQHIINTALKHHFRDRLQKLRWGGARRDEYQTIEDILDVMREVDEEKMQTADRYEMKREEKRGEGGGEGGVEVTDREAYESF